MDRDISFGSIVKEHRQFLDLTQAELARRVACATITIRKIEADALRPSIQIAERLATSLKIPLEDRAAFVRLARTTSLKTPTPQPLPTPPPTPEEIGLEDLSGRAIRGYELGDRIGEGGFGVVYRAIQPLVEREVAVKIILPRYADHPEFIRRFEAEAQLVARLEHPHIVPLYDYWREPGAAFLVMRLMRGDSLYSLIHNGPLSLEFILRLLNQVGGALYAAHRMGVIHRDLKPANILLDEDQNTYLADFGVAKNLSNPIQTSDTMLAGIVGSPAYVSPEQIRAEPIRPQADIYALGILLFQLLTGQQPFRGPTPIDYVQQHLNQSTPSLLDYNPNLPQKLEPVLERATAKTPADRYNDIPSLVSDFRSAIASTGVDLPPAAALEWLPAEQVDLEAIENPYKGLRAFEEADSKHFFGRETLVQELLGRMSEENDLSRFLAVVGPSGSGKSSAVKAGLIPSLRRGGLPGSEHWFIVEFTPGAHPFEELETALLRVAVNPPDSLLGQLRFDARGLLRAVQRILPPDKEVELVLVVDQFEELFTLVENEDTRAAFLDSLVTALLDPHSRLRVVITLRADFTDRPLEYVDFGELLRQRAEFVLPLTPDELEETILKPARGAGLVLESGLCQGIVSDLGDQPGTLPLLQYALTELFERRSGRRLTLMAYQDSGGVLGALGNRAEEIYLGLDPGAQETARQVFLRLVTLGEGVEDTRRRVLQTELEALTPIPSPINGRGEKGVREVLNSFGRARLLSFDLDPLTRGPTVEVAHEALLRKWSRLREWLNQSRAEVRNQRALSSAARDWREAGQDPSFLLRGARLEQFAAWAESTDLTLTQIERDYLQASLEEHRAREAAEAERLAHEAALERRSRNILRILVGVFAIASVISLILAWLAISARNETIAQQEIAQAEARQRATAEVLASEQQQQAMQQADARATAEAKNALRQAEEQRAVSAEIALRALDELKGPNPELAALVPLELLDPEKYPYTPQAERTLNKAVLDHPSRYITVTRDEDIAVGFLGWFPGVDVLAISRGEDTILVRDAIRDEVLVTLPEGCNWIPAWSPSGDHYIAFGDECPVAIYSTLTGEQVALLESPPHVWHNTAAWSPDGSRLANGGDDALVRIWDAATGQLLQEFPGHTHFVVSVDWSPDGKYLASASRDQTVRVWDAETGEQLQTISHIAPVNEVAWSPDGSKIASAAADNVAHIWDPLDGRRLLRMIGHRRALFDVTWSPDGQRIATASEDQTTRIWDAESGQQLFQFNNHDELPIIWSPSGGQLLIPGFYYLRVWDLSQLPPVLEGHTDQVLQARYAPGGQQVATSSKDHTLRIWDATQGELLKVLNLEGQPLSIAWSPSGEQMASSSQDGSLVIWGVDSGDRLDLPNPTEAAIASLTWSPDGAILAGLEGASGLIKAWDPESGAEIQLSIGDPGCPAARIAWSRENSYLLAGCRGGDKLSIWDPATGERVYALDPGNVTISAQVWSPDGKRIALAFADGSLQVYELANLTNPAWVLPGQGETIFDLGWAPNSQRIATAESGGSVRIWDLASQAEISTFHVPGEARSVDWSPGGDQVIITSSLGTFPFIHRAWQSTEDLIRAAHQCCVERELTPEERTRFGLPAE